MHTRTLIFLPLYFRELHNGRNTVHYAIARNEVVDMIRRLRMGCLWAVPSCRVHRYASTAYHNDTKVDIISQSTGCFPAPSESTSSETVGSDILIFLASLAVGNKV